MDDLFSDSDGEKAVEELLSQAMDSAMLEQVASINCAGFTDSGLPSHLETRFQRLKSLPSPAAPKPPAFMSLRSFNLSRPAGVEKPEIPNGGKNSSASDEKKAPTTRSTISPEENDSPPDSYRSPLEENRRKKMEKIGRRNTPSSSSSFSSLSSRSISPPARSGCFLCSPKKMHSTKKMKKKNKKNTGLDSRLDWGKRDSKLLSDLSNFSGRSQRKMMKKAMEEEEKVCREAERIVNWAKQASARMELPSDLEDKPSDDENANSH